MFCLFRFTPDFTMSRIRRTLTIYTSLGPVANYTLQATVPPHTLSKCSSALPRPNWEPVLYYSIACVMGFLLFCILVAAYFEADRLFVADIIRRKIRVNNMVFDKSKVFDLKKVVENSHHTPSYRVVSTPTVEPVTTPPKPISEVANGHIEQAGVKKESFPVTLVNIIRNLFSQKWSRPSRKKEAEKQEKSSPVSNNQANRVIEKEKVQTQSQENVISEKSTTHVPQRGRSKKAAKRQNSNDLATSQAENLSGDRRHIGKEAYSQDRKSHDNKSDVMEKITKQTAVKTSSINDIDTFDLLDDPRIEGHPNNDSKFVKFSVLYK